MAEDDILLQEIDKLKQEKELVIRQQNSNKPYALFAGGLTVCTVATASFGLWYGLVACLPLWIGLAIIYANRPGSGAKLINVFFLDKDGWGNWGVRQRYDNGDSRSVTGYNLTQTQAEKELTRIANSDAYTDKTG